MDTAEILKGSALTDDEYFRSAVLGWCVELVSCLRWLRGPKAEGALAAGILPGRGRYDGPVGDPQRAALLVQGGQCSFSHLVSRLIQISRA